MTLREATHVSPALAVSAALAVVLGASPAAAQRATASLIPVASGVVDNAGPWPPVDSEMCLRGSAYVLAFERGAGDGEGYATVKVGAPPDSREVAGMTLTPADQDGWAWVLFTVDDYTCFNLSAINGRARVYQLRVGVDW